MRLLGHKNIKNTLIYTQLVPFQDDDQFICKVTTNVKEACELIEKTGFRYVTGEYDAMERSSRNPNNQYVGGPKRAGDGN